MPPHFCGNLWHDIPAYLVYAAAVAVPVFSPAICWVASKFHRTHSEH